MLNTNSLVILLKTGKKAGSSVLSNNSLVFPYGINYTFKLLALAGLNRYTTKKSAEQYLVNFNHLLFRKILLKAGKLKKNFIASTGDQLNFLVVEKFYKGLRYKAGLPLRGQRTHTNAKTSKRLHILK
jgi:ribosomal protein S13